MRHLCHNLYIKLYGEKQTKDLRSRTNFYIYLEGTDVTVISHIVKENMVALIVILHLFICITGGVENNFHSVSHMLTAFSIQKLIASENCVPSVSVFSEHLD